MYDTFRESMKISDIGQQITDVMIETPTNHSSSRRDIVFCFVEYDVGIHKYFVISKKGSSLQITLKLRRNHDLNAFADISFHKTLSASHQP